MKLNNSLHICVTGGAGYIGSHILVDDCSTNERVIKTIKKSYEV